MDLLVHVTGSKDTRSVDEMISMAQHLGWKGVALVNAMASPALLSRTTTQSLNILSRADCHENSVQRAKKWLRHLHPGSAIVGFNIRNRQTLEFGLRDGRFDVLNLDLILGFRGFDSGFVNLLAKTQKIVEVTVRPLTEMRGYRLSTCIANMRTLVSSRKLSTTPLRFSSGANNPYELRSPHELRALATALGMKDEAVLGMLSSPNISRLHHTFASPPRQ